MTLKMGGKKAAGRARRRNHPRAFGKGVSEADLQSLVHEGLP